jgi:hypothetical protein
VVKKRPIAAVCLGGALLAGCNAVLGITSATVDPTLSVSATADASGSDSAPAPFSCGAYCGKIAQSCSNTDQEYTSAATCEAMCSHFDPGVPGEQTNDSLACRISQTNLAASAPRVHCQQAGPLAVGSCVATPCSAYCALAFDLCNPLNLFPYNNQADCRAACSAWPYLKSTDGDAGTVGDILFASGNTLNCRIYHLESGYEVGNPTAPGTHCPHLGDPSAPCN